MCPSRHRACPVLHIRARPCSEWPPPTSEADRVIPCPTNDTVFSYNPDFWSSRANIPDPRALFKEEGASGEAAVARARAIKEAKLKPSTEQNAAH